MTGMRLAVERKEKYVRSIRSMIHITTHIVVNIMNVNATYPGETNCSNAVRKHVA